MITIQIDERTFNDVDAHLNKVDLASAQLKDAHEVYKQAIKIGDIDLMLEAHNTCLSLLVGNFERLSDVVVIFAEMTGYTWDKP